MRVEPPAGEFAAWAAKRRAEWLVEWAPPAA
jgi:hypothetical protein